MKTIATIGFLILYAVIADFLIVIVLNIADLLGVVIAGKSETRSKRRFIFGSILSALGQSYGYLAYTASS